MTKVQIRRGSSAQWSTANPVLSDGEQGWDTTLRNTKTGNGVTAWNSLAFDNAGKADAARTIGYQNPGTSVEGIYTNNGRAPVIVDSPTAMGGKAIAKVGTQHGWWVDRNGKQPFDPTVLYRFSIRLRVTQASTVVGGGTLYLGVQGYAADGTTYVNSTGTNDTSNQHYIHVTALPADAVTNKTWVDYVVYFRDNAAGNMAGGNTASNPKKLHANVRYFEPLMILDYNGGDGTWEVSHYSIDVVDADGLTALNGLNGKANTSHAHSATDITGGTLPDARLPARLGPYAQTVTDWNSARANGWYMAAGALNAPSASWFIGNVEAHNDIWVTQTLHGFTTDNDSTYGDTWRRSSDNGVWGAWYRLQLSQAEQDARYPLKSAVGAANGVASLGADGKVPSAQLPPAASTTVLQTKLTNGQPEIVTNQFRMYGPKGTRLTLPTHVAGNTTGEATHPSVVFRAEGWGTGGYPYWMAMTPYPGANDAYEDPDIICSRDGINWVVPAGLTNPIDNAPGSPAAYNSDTELAFGPDDALYAFWRNLDPNSPGTEEKIYYRRSTNGVTWEPKVLVYQSNQNIRRLLSPTIMWEDGAWTMWAVDIVPSLDKIVRLRSNTSLPSWAGGWSEPVDITYVNGLSYQANKGPWHISIIKAYGRYHMLVNDNSLTSPPPVGDLIYMTSTDGIAWSSGVNPCLPRVQAGQHDMMYRATMIPAVERGVQGFRVWYGALTYYTTPQKWSIFRTFISDAPHSLRGEATITVAAANGSVPSGAQAAITFDPPFKDIPDLVLTSNSTLLGLGYDNLTGNGVTIFAENFTAYAANNVKIRWTVTEPY